jgi:hypothetical protein
MTVRGSTTVKIPLCRHKNIAKFLDFMFWNIALFHVDTLGYIISFICEVYKKICILI